MANYVFITGINKDVMVTVFFLGVDRSPLNDGKSENFIINRSKRKVLGPRTVPSETKYLQIIAKAENLEIKSVIPFEGIKRVLISRQKGIQVSESTNLRFRIRKNVVYRTDVTVSFIDKEKEVIKGTQLAFSLGNNPQLRENLNQNKRFINKDIPVSTEYISVLARINQPVGEDIYLRKSMIPFTQNQNLLISISESNITVRELAAFAN